MPLTKTAASLSLMKILRMHILDTRDAYRQYGTTLIKIMVIAKNSKKVSMIL